MNQYRITGYDRETNEKITRTIEAVDEDAAIKLADMLVESVKKLVAGQAVAAPATPSPPPAVRHISPTPPPYAHASAHVHVNVQNNALGTASCIVSIIGWFTCGLLCPIGFLLGLFGMGKEPRGMALAGLIIGGVGSLVPVVIFLIFGTAIFGVCGCTSAALVGLGQQQLATEDAADAIKAHYKTSGQLPDDATAATLIAPFTHEGHAFRYRHDGVGDFFYIEHPGDDGTWDTLDDWDAIWDASEPISQSSTP